MIREFVASFNMLLLVTALLPPSSHFRFVFLRGMHRQLSQLSHSRTYHKAKDGAVARVRAQEHSCEKRTEKEDEENSSEGGRE